jgi:hypothetical protein
LASQPEPFFRRKAVKIAGLALALAVVLLVGYLVVRHFPPKARKPVSISGQTSGLVDPGFSVPRLLGKGFGRMNLIVLELSSSFSACFPDWTGERQSRPI